MSSLLYAREQKITDAVSVLVPQFGSVFDNEDLYYDIVCTIVSTPFDLMVQLDDAGIDFTQINDFELFCLLFPRLQEMDTSLVFGDLDLSGFQTAENTQNGSMVLWNEETGAVIDRAAHDRMAKFLRKMLHLEKNNKRPANEEARKYLIEKERRKQKRQKKKARTSTLESYVVALVNSCEFPYNYETVRDISIYQFYCSLNQITHKIKFDNTMIGYYAGTVKFDDLSQADRTWILNS